MTPTTTRAVLLDLDGTLVDSAPDLATSINYALSLIGKEAVDDDTVRSFIGNGADRLIHRAITQDYDGEAPTESYLPARDAFLTHYADNVCQKSVLYPTVEETLDYLRTAGFHIACVTNKPHQFTRPLLEALNIDEYFSLTLSGDSLANKKPAPDQLLHAAEFYGLTAHQCLMVGDTNTDISAALNCNMPAIFVNYGYGKQTDIDARFSGSTISKLNEILDLL